MTIVATFRARYEGGCSEDPEHRVQPGEVAGWTDDDRVVCAECVEAAK